VGSIRHHTATAALHFQLLHIYKIQIPTYTNHQDGSKKRLLVEPHCRPKLISTYIQRPRLAPNSVLMLHDAATTRVVYTPYRA
jgi:hypothetical protein